MAAEPFDKLTADARSLAQQVGTQTTEALIRAASGAREGASAAVETAQAGAASAGQVVGQAAHEVAAGMPDARMLTPSARLAWRTGRLVGRLEGAIRLAAFGMRFWLRSRKRRGHEQQRLDWIRPLLQWGPTAVASVYLGLQLLRWARARAAAD